MSQETDYTSTTTKPTMREQCDVWTFAYCVQSFHYFCAKPILSTSSTQTIAENAKGTKAKTALKGETLQRKIWVASEELLWQPEESTSFSHRAATSPMLFVNEVFQLKGFVESFVRGVQKKWSQMLTVAWSRRRTQLSYITAQSFWNYWRRVSLWLNGVDKRIFAALCHMDLENICNSQLRDLKSVVHNLLQTAWNLTQKKIFFCLLWLW